VFIIDCNGVLSVIY